MPDVPAGAGVLAYLLRDQLLDRRRRPNRLLENAPEPEATDIVARPVVLQLGSQPDGWLTLSATYGPGGANDRDKPRDSDSNPRPWSRSIGLLRGLGAQTVVVEQHYVCLDWRSELASFHAHLDAQRRNYSTRLHFFSKPVFDADIFALSEEQVGSYLGFMIVREGELPVVGRTVLQLPVYMTEEHPVVATIREPVHFFGQELFVTGVPFMQQDERFATCAHIVAWMAHYMSYRRGFHERRYVADFVHDAGAAIPLRPGMREGLTVPQVSKLFQRLEFRLFSNTTPLAHETHLPKLPAKAAPGLRDRIAALVEKLPEDLDLNLDDLPDLDEDIAFFVSVLFERVVDSADGDAGAFYEKMDPKSGVCLAMELVLAHIATAYLASGFPLYVSNKDHALLLYGIGTNEAGDLEYYLHDDENGPYLKSNSLLRLSREQLQAQAEYCEQVEPLVAPEESLVNDERAAGLAGGGEGKASCDEEDAVLEKQVLSVDVLATTTPIEDRIHAIDAYSFKGDLGIMSILMPVPSRVLLPCSAAQRDSASMAEFVYAQLADGDLGSDIPVACDVASVLLMGISYKEQRLAQLRGRGASASEALNLTASTHLAEWVVVTQGLDKSGDVVWEVVSDGSSSPASPRVQLVRVGPTWVSLDPTDDQVFGWAETTDTAFPRIVVPQGVTKYVGGGQLTK